MLNCVLPSRCAGDAAVRGSERMVNSVAAMHHLLHEVVTARVGDMEWVGN